MFIYYTPGDAVNDSASSFRWFDIYTKTWKELTYPYVFDNIASSFAFAIAEVDSVTMVTNQIEFTIAWQAPFLGNLSEIFIRGDLTPTENPTTSPSNIPSAFPTHPSTSPTEQPSGYPSLSPSSLPSAAPTDMPSQPTALPSISPTEYPSNVPTATTHGPSEIPTSPPVQIKVEKGVFRVFRVLRVLFCVFGLIVGFLEWFLYIHVYMCVLAVNAKPIPAVCNVYMCRTSSGE